MAKRRTAKKSVNAAKNASASSVPRAAGEGRPQAKKRRSIQGRHRRWPLVVAGVLVALVVVAGGAVSWDRWLRYDDARDIQGTWQAPGATNTVVIDGATIHLTDEVAYHYTIDPFAKTLSYTFGNLTGQGRYRFSDGRATLIIEEGGTPSWASTLVADIGVAWDDLARAAQGLEPARPTASDTVTVLVRTAEASAAAEAPVPETAPTSEPEAAPEPETEPVPESAPAPENEPQKNEGNGSGTPATSEETLDVNDVAA